MSDKSDASLLTVMMLAGAVMALIRASSRQPLALQAKPTFSPWLQLSPLALGAAMKSFILSRVIIEHLMAFHPS